MKKLGIRYSWFTPTGLSPLESVAGYMPRENPLLLVHNTFSTEKDVDFALSAFDNVFWALCPNANLYIEDALPDVPLLIEKSAQITIGTDSPASNRKLSVLEEIKTISGKFPQIPLAEMLKWSSLNGARFLGIDDRYGSFRKGRQPGINLISGLSEDHSSLTADTKVLRIA